MASFGFITRHLRRENLIKTLRNPHVWVIVVASFFLWYVYSAWPWGRWVPSEGAHASPFWVAWLRHLAFIEVTNHVVGILFFVPILYASVVLSWRGALFTALIALAAVSPLIIRWPFFSTVTNLALLLLPLFVVSLIAFEIRTRRKERRVALAREAERRELQAKIIESQENERRHLAQELHDETIQTLLVIANHAHSLSTAAARQDSIRDTAERIREIALQTIEELRRISIALMPSVLDTLGLVPALRWLADNATKDSGIKTRLTVRGDYHGHDRQEELAIFRTVQEALTNIKKHAHAFNSYVTLDMTNGSIKLTIRDDGQGFRPPKRIESLGSSGRLGLYGIQQRVHALRGTLSLRSRAGRGTTLSIELPAEEN